jgi:hypothetical protein
MKQKLFINVLLVLIFLASIVLLDYYSINLLKARARDARRISDLNLVASTFTSYKKFNKSYPKANNYQALDKNLSMFLKALPQDPLNRDNFHYQLIKKDENFVLLARMETNNYFAKADKGFYNKKPLYYELGSGHWQSLIPKNLK